MIIPDRNTLVPNMVSPLRIALLAVLLPATTVRAKHVFIVPQAGLQAYTSGSPMAFGFTGGGVVGIVLTWVMRAHPSSGSVRSIAS